MAGAHDGDTVAGEPSSKDTEADSSHKTGNINRKLISASTLLSDVRDAKDEDLARVRMLERIVSDIEQFMVSKWQCDYSSQ